MNHISKLCLVAVLTLFLCAAQAQAQPNSAEVRGNMRMEVVTVPEAVADTFQRLNPQALLYHPIETTTAKQPLIIVLHGSGGSKRSIERSKWTGEVREFIAPKDDRPRTHILVPQSNGEWVPASLNKLLDHVLETTPTIDTNRIYCIGYSMGGKGTWEWAMTSPKRFAAIIPKGFIPDLSAIDGMVTLPIWAMVGTKDSKPRVEGIPTMEQALKARGSTAVRTTLFEGANHGTTPKEIKQLKGVYEWLFAHSLPRE